MIYQDRYLSPEDDAVTVTARGALVAVASAIGMTGFLIAAIAKGQPSLLLGAGLFAAVNVVCFLVSWPFAPTSSRGTAVLGRSGFVWVTEESWRDRQTEDEAGRELARAMRAGGWDVSDDQGRILVDAAEVAKFGRP